MTQKIIHISDTHFGNQNPTYSLEKIKNLLIAEINKIDGDRILVISGDITFKASNDGYEQASAFFREIITNCGIPQSNVIACPGNHDICPGASPFRSFDKFIYSLRRDHEISFKKNHTIIIPAGETVFIIINSAHHCDHKFGLIPQEALETLRNNKEPFERFKKRVLITHHHLIGIQESDTSTTRNAYSLLHQLDQLNFNYILHGHQHSKFDFPVGKSGIKISSARSLSYHDRGFSNGINILDIESGDIKFLIMTPDEIPGQLIAGVLK